MQSFFSGENFFFRATGRILDLVVLSLLWLVCCLPLITVGPATAALYYSCVKCLRYGESAPYQNFFTAFRQNLKPGIGLSVVFWIAAAVLYGVFRLLSGMLPAGETVKTVVQVAYGFLMLLPLGIFSGAAALVSRFQYALEGLLSDSVQIVFRHFFPMSAVALLNGWTVFRCLRLFYLLVWLILPAIDALLVSYLLEPVLRKYTPVDEETEQLDPEDRPWYLR